MIDRLVDGLINCLIGCLSVLFFQNTHSLITIKDTRQPMRESILSAIADELTASGPMNASTPASTSLGQSSTMSSFAAQLAAFVGVDDSINEGNKANAKRKRELVDLDDLEEGEEFEE